MNRTFTKQQVKNIKEAIVMWASVPSKNVYPGLDDWRDFSQELQSSKVTCDTIACFGGWCCHWPAFTQQGLRATGGGAPILNEAHGGAVAEEMFGDIDLFLPRGAHPADKHSLLVDDHTVVMNRLKTLLAEATRETA